MVYPQLVKQAELPGGALWADPGERYSCHKNVTVRSRSRIKSWGFRERTCQVGEDGSRRRFPNFFYLLAPSLSLSDASFTSNRVSTRFLTEGHSFIITINQGCQNQQPQRAFPGLVLTKAPSIYRTFIRPSTDTVNERANPRSLPVRNFRTTQTLEIMCVTQCTNLCPRLKSHHTITQNKNRLRKLHPSNFPTIIFCAKILTFANSNAIASFRWSPVFS